MKIDVKFPCGYELHIKTGLFCLLFFMYSSQLKDTCDVTLDECPIHGKECPPKK